MYAFLVSFVCFIGTNFASSVLLGSLSSLGIFTTTTSIALRGVIYDERSDFMNGFWYDCVMATCDTFLVDFTIANCEIRFRIVTLSTENKFLNKAIKKVLEFVGIVAAVNNEQIIIDCDLGTKFTAKVFSGIFNIVMKAKTNQQKINLNYIDRSNLI